jgi:hypothetical protein
MLLSLSFWIKSIYHLWQGTAHHPHLTFAKITPSSGAISAAAAPTRTQ